MSEQLDRALSTAPHRVSSRQAPSLPDDLAVFDRHDGGEAVIQLRCDQPRLALIRDFLSPDECRQLIALSGPLLRQSLTYSTGSETPHRAEKRTSEDVSFPRGEGGLISQIESRVARLFGWPAESATGFQVVRYLPGQQFQPHMDCVDAGGTEANRRVATLIIYLNDVPRGGSTEFVDAGISVTPCAGQALFFAYPSRRRASMTMHAGRPIETGEKWIATKWFHECQ
jgi:prolyl 4-hydroxylase